MHLLASSRIFLLSGLALLASVVGPLETAHAVPHGAASGAEAVLQETAPPPSRLPAKAVHPRASLLLGFADVALDLDEDGSAHRVVRLRSQRPACPAETARADSAPAAVARYLLLCTFRL